MENNYLIPEDDLKNYLGIYDEDESSEFSKKITEEIKSKYKGKNKNYLPPGDEEDLNEIENNYLSSYGGDKNQQGINYNQINYNQPTNYSVPSNYDQPNEISGTGYNNNQIKQTNYNDPTNYDQPESSNYLIGDNNYNNYKGNENINKRGDINNIEDNKYTIPTTSNYDNPEVDIKGYNPTGEIKEENKYTIPEYSEEKKYTIPDNEENQYLMDNTGNYDNPEDTIKENKNDSENESEMDIQVNSSSLAKLLKGIKWSKPSKVNPNPPEWNKKFQELMSMDESYQKYDGLRNLAQDFVYCAETYGRIIISEKCLPNEKKTIKSVGIGGIAGGEKYIVQGILFKFAIDFEGIYGGDEGAMKAAGHELNGLMTYFNHRVEGLHFPLMALIDYRGYRVTAISLLPIGKDTIVYGSFDAGNTVHDSEPKVNDMMEKLGKKMNVKGHIVGGKKKVNIYGPADIEVHKGKDGKFYVLDFARYLPPEPPGKTNWQKTLYQLLRPEFVQKWKTSLSPDAFSRMGIHDHKIHKEEVEEAFKHLLVNTVPSLAKNLDENFYKEHENDPPKLILVFHEMGVNMRQMGRVRYNSKNEEIKKLLLIEALVRTMKCQLRSLYREMMSQLTVPNDQIFKSITSEYLNLVLGNDEMYEDSVQFWNGELKSTLIEKFEKILSLEELEMSNIKDLIDYQDKILILNRLKSLLNIRFTDNCTKIYTNTNYIDSFFFVDSDIISIESNVKHLNLVDYAGGMALIFKVKESTNNNITNERILGAAQEMLAKALRSTAGSVDTLVQLAKVFHMLTDSASSKSVYFEKACSIYENIIKISPKFVESYLNYGELLKEYGRHKEAKQIYQKIFEFDPQNHLALYSLANLFIYKLRRAANISTKLLSRTQKSLVDATSIKTEDKELLSKANFLFGNFIDFFLNNPNIKYEDPVLETLEESELVECLSKKCVFYFNTSMELDPSISQQILGLFPYNTKELVLFSRLIKNGCNILPSVVENSPNIQKIEFSPSKELDTELQTILFEKVFIHCKNLSVLNFKSKIALSPLIIPSLLNIINNNSSTLKSVHLPFISFEENFDFDQFFGKFPQFSVLEEFGLFNFSSLKDSSFKIISKKILNLKTLDLGFCTSIGVETLEVLKDMKELKELDISGCDELVESIHKFLKETNLTKLKMSDSKKIQFSDVEALSKESTSLSTVSLERCEQIDPIQFLYLPSSTCSFYNTNGCFMFFPTYDLTLSGQVQDHVTISSKDVYFGIEKPRMLSKVVMNRYGLYTSTKFDITGTKWEFGHIESATNSTKLCLNRQQIFFQTGHVNKGGIFRVVDRNFCFTSVNMNLPVIVYEFTQNDKIKVGYISRSGYTLSITVTKGYNYYFVASLLVTFFIMDGRQL